MPGLVGAVNLNNNRINVNLISGMRDAIRHRDWYQVDDYMNARGSVAVSRVHLGIIRNEKQPYFFRGGDVKIFLHGEIYENRIDHSDLNKLELVYSLYEKYDIDFPSFLNGSFVIIIIDESKNTTIIANDRIASKPMFYFNDGKSVYFGPEIKSLLLTPSLRRKINLKYVADFLTNGFATREHTLIEGIESIDNSTVVKISEYRIIQHKYWNYSFEKSTIDRGEKYYQYTLSDLLRESVKKRIKTNNTYGILLSGGYDSRAILGCYMEAMNGHNLQTISWGEREEIPNSDCSIAKNIAQNIGAHHRFYRLSAEDVIDNFYDFIFLGEGRTRYLEYYEIFHMIREQGIDIVFRGDECFGWEDFLVHDEHTMFRRLMIGSLQNIKIYQKILKPFYHQIFSKFDRDTRNYVSSRCSEKDLHDRKDFFYLDVRLKYFINPLNYVKNFALESFNPWLDYDILDFVSNLPTKYRLSKILYRKTIFDMFPELFKYNAKVRNDIDWYIALKKSPELKSFVYKNLLQESSILDEFINKVQLKNELDAFFAISKNFEGYGLRKNMKGVISKWREISPHTLNIAHKSHYYIQKWRAKIVDPFPPERMILHLLILKLCGDVFLSYPVVNVSN